MSICPCLSLLVCSYVFQYMCTPLCLLVHSYIHLYVCMSISTIISDIIGLHQYLIETTSSHLIPAWVILGWVLGKTIM